MRSKERVNHKSGLRVRGPGAIFPLLILAISFALTWLATYYVERSATEADNSRFRQSTQAAKDAIEARFESDIALLRGTSGLFARGQLVTRADFESFVSSLRVEERGRGLEAIGFSAYVPAGGEVMMRSRAVTERVENFRYWPDQASELHAVLYVVPNTPGNANEIGFNFFADPELKSAAVLARTTGEPTASAPLPFRRDRSDDPRTALYVIAPTYGRELPATPEERLSRLSGFVFMKFDSDEAIGASVQSVRGDNFELQVIDVTGGAAEEIFSSDAFKRLAQAGYRSQATDRTRISIAGRQWALDFQATPQFAAMSEHRFAPFVLFGGLALSFVLFTLAYLEGLARKGTQSETHQRIAAQRELQRSEARLRALVEQAPIAVLVLSPDGKVVGANKGFDTLWGLNSEELAGTSILEVFSPIDSRLASFTKKALSGKRAQLDPIERDLRPSQSTQWLAGHAYPVKDSDGEITEIVAIFQDLTSIKQAEEVVLKANEQLENRVDERTKELEVAMSEMEAFSYSVAHDLRSPLRAMSSFARILGDEHAAEIDEEAKGYLTRIIENSVRMGELIDGLLDLSKISRVTLNKTIVDVSQIAKETLHSLQKRTPREDLAFRVAPNLCVEADERLMGALLENLLGNAWKFTGRTEGACIEFGLEGKGSDAAFFVRDNGAGFDQGYVDKLFKPFERLHSGSDFTGTGIGLATVRRIVERHGGRVWAKGQLGKGASFYFWLPKIAMCQGSRHEPVFQPD